MSDWMQTYSGGRFYPLEPSIDDIYPMDIGHALSMLCRYGGHVKRFYSVAEHCVLMSQAVSPENRLWALLHDATEAYLGDMIRPLKTQMFAYREAENRLMYCICVRFGLGHNPYMPVEVSTADLRILLDERNALMAAPPHPWIVDDGTKPLGVQIQGWQPEQARAAYLARLEELTRIPL